MRKIYIVPNLVTTGNMFCGFYSMVASIHKDFTLAAWAIVAAQVFDALDGRVARLARATSRFGVEYDSLSDLTSFGMAPAVLLYLWALEPFGRLGWGAAFLFLACGALRLARFNVTTETAPKNYFQGLPIPGGAGVVATFVIFCQAMDWAGFESFVLIMTFVLAALMISTVPFPSFKEVNWRSRASFAYLLAGLVAMVLIASRPEIMLFLLLALYVCCSLLWNVWRWFKGASPGKSAS